MTDSVPDRLDERVVALPGHAWNIAASVLSDAVFGAYGDSKVMDFREVGYLGPPPEVDIGVEVIGAFAEGAFATTEELVEAYDALRSHGS